MDTEKLLELLKIAYIAGLIDGEGCFFVSHRFYYEKSCVQLQLIVAMSSREPLDVCQEVFGGSVNQLSKENKLHHRWILCSNNAVKATERLFPFLKGKQKQAYLFLEYYKAWRIPKEQRNWELLDAIESELKSLKKTRNVLEFTFSPLAETERVDDESRCDSPNYMDGKHVEATEMIAHSN